MKTLLLTERELNHIVALLVESKREEFLKKKYNVSDKDMEYVKKLDPTPNKKYMEWLIRIALPNVDWLADRYEDFKKYLSYYAQDNIRKSLDEKHQDINNFKYLGDFATVMEKVKPEYFVSKSEVLKDTYVTTIDNFDIHIPKSHAESCKIGIGCIAADTSTGLSHFRKYSGKGDIYVFINRDDRSEKYQYNKGQAYVADRDNKQIKNFLPKHPDIVKFLNDRGALNPTQKRLHNIPIEGGEITNTELQYEHAYQADTYTVEEMGIITNPDDFFIEGQKIDKKEFLEIINNDSLYLDDESIDDMVNREGSVAYLDEMGHLLQGHNTFNYYADRFLPTIQFYRYDVKDGRILIAASITEGDPRGGYGEEKYYLYDDETNIDFYLWRLYAHFTINDEIYTAFVEDGANLNSFDVSGDFYEMFGQDFLSRDELEDMGADFSEWA